MSHNKRFATLSAVPLVVVLAIMALAPGALAQSKYKMLYKFTGGADGGSPMSNLIFDAAGNLYGTTVYGGTHGDGTVFKLTPKQEGAWKESVLYSFCSLSNCDDGASPNAGVIFDAAGNLYGTTTVGGGDTHGYNGFGTVFKLTPNSNGRWTETVLHRFYDHPGANPYAGLIFDAAGNLYGTTRGDGFTTFGTVFEIIMP